MNPSHAGHDVRSGTSTRSRSGHARADLLAIPHLPHAAPRARTDYQTASFAGLVFLTMHGVDGEDAAGQAERFDQALHSWDLVRRLLDDFMSQDDPMIDRESAEHMRRLSVREGIEAAPKRLAVDRNEARW